MTTETNTFNQSRWSLKDLFPSAGSPEMENAFKQAEKMVADFEKKREILTEDISAETFLEVIKALEALTRQIRLINDYAELWFTEDTQNQQAQSLAARTEQFVAEQSNKVLFFNLWWKSVSDKTAQRLMDASGDYRYWLEEMRHFKPYTLTEAEEKIINIKDLTGFAALIRLYDSITNRYTFRLTVDGQEKDLTRGELMSLVRQSNPDQRASAYQKLYQVYGDEGPILGQIYQTIIRDWRNENIGLRKYKTPISARNLGNDIPDEVVDTLLDICKKNAPVFQRFFRLKAKWLGVDTIRRYDVYAPVAESNKNYSFGMATELVLDSFQEFDPRFAQLAHRVFASGHIDSEVRKGKRSGAFCATVAPDLTPWVLTNYQGKAEDMATLAHELGHAIHSLLASEHSIFTQHSCLPLAETASTFGEMMLIDRLLSEEKDEEVRRDLLFRQIDDSYATIMRQAFFAMFEKTAHEMTLQGAAVDDLAEAYYRNLQDQFGNSLALSDEFRWEWVSIPHFYHTPFYVYAYAFGQLLVLSLYKQFKVEGDSFKPRYIHMLSTGGSKAPMQILDEAGMDVRKAEFWQGGFDLIDAMVTQLEAL
ncbi:MAG: M3 family oligoendopeptidase [Anaerolineaceae bacterium]|jgi:oligoendopeptidase F|nr:MAG: M3 family oligoendopeptidase [Anaerolineaceae bacterium]